MPRSFITSNNTDSLFSLEIIGDNVDFNTTSDPLFSFGVTDNYTIAAWLKANTVNDSYVGWQLSTFSPASFIFVDFNAFNANQIRLGVNKGASVKDYRFNNLQVVDTWNLWSVTTNGTAMTLYKDGVAQTPDTILNDDVITGIVDTNRTVVGGFANAGVILQQGPWAIWDKILTAAELLELAQGDFSFNWTVNSGNYASSANLEHYWRHAFGNEMGLTDLGVGTARNLTGTFSTITPDHIVMDHP